jgi:diphosphomevalonate decarboxylase
MKKATVKSPANIAFVKYWGRTNDKLILPMNDSISMNMDNCFTITTVEFGDFPKDIVKIKFFNQNYQDVQGSQLDRVLLQVDRFKKQYKIKQKVKIYSQNNFPSDAGIASSASAFSALTKALYSALEKKISQKQLTIETRLAGSGSATRSICDGYVQWNKGKPNDSQSSYAHTLYDHTYWDLCDVLAVVDTGKKSVGSYEGHGLAHNEYQIARLKNVNKRLKQIKQGLKQKDIEKLGEAIEQDAISMHAVAMSSNPPIFYLNGRTFDVINALFQARKEGIPAFFTMDAGPNVHVICEKKDSQKVSNILKKLPAAQFVINNQVAKGAQEINNHLF